MNYIKQRNATREIVLLSFADTRYIKSMYRLKNEAMDFPFTTTLFLTEKDLDEDFRKKLRPKHYPRGYGYWKWKSFLISSVLDELKDGDILMYSDAGTHLESKGMNRFFEYLKMVEENENGILTFQQTFLEKDYAKGDLIDFCGAYHNNDILMSLQLWGGVIILSKSRKCISIVKEWADLCCNHFDLITDKASKLSNAKGFRENRHDQAAMSLIFKKYSHVEIPWWEVDYMYPEEEKVESKKPIQAQRLKGRDQSLFAKLKRKSRILFQYIWGTYLVLFEGFYFGGKRSW